MSYESSDPERGDVYDELFVITEYVGSYNELEEQIEDIDGVFKASVSLNNSDHPEDPINGGVNVEIKYDTIETDRTQISLFIEDFENTVGEAVSG